MAIREDLVASATQFLQDPSVTASSVENRIAFLRTKNLTQEEIDVALARAGAGPPTAYMQSAVQAPQPQQYYQPYSQHAWQPPPPPVPRRDWRDWFIMATVMSGVGYGLYTLTKRYVYPMIAPPTPERLEEDKKTIDDQFEKAFALIDQLAKDTETLKTAEQERTQRLDTALAELESVLSEIKSANRRRDDEAQRIKDDIYGLKDSIPKAMDAQKNVVESRLREVNTELTSLKTLMTQRLNPPSTSSGTSNHLRPSSGNSGPTPAAAKVAAGGAENSATEAAATPSTEQVKAVGAGSQGRASPFSANTGRASIPAWQLAMANKVSTPTANGSESGASSQTETATS